MSMHARTRTHGALPLPHRVSIIIGCSHEKYTQRSHACACVLAKTCPLPISDARVCPRHPPVGRQSVPIVRICIRLWTISMVLRACAHGVHGLLRTRTIAIGRLPHHRHRRALDTAFLGFSVAARRATAMAWSAAVLFYICTGPPG